jgi:hypothetical protein
VNFISSSLLLKSLSMITRQNPTLCMDSVEISASKR